MALWMRGGKDWSRTLHLQSAQWVVLVTTSFSPSLSISLMLLTWSPHFPHALPFNNAFFSIWLLPTIPGWVRPYSKAPALPLCFDLSGFSFAFTFPSPLLFFWAKLYILENFGTPLDSAPKLVHLGKSSGLSDVGQYAYEGTRSEGKLDLEPQDRIVTEHKCLLDH